MSHSAICTALRAAPFLIWSLTIQKVMQNSLNISASEVISTYTYKAAFASSNSNYSYSTAIGLFNSVVNGGMLVLVNVLAGKFSGNSLW